MDYCALAVPASITQKIGTKAAVLVMATLNGSEPFKVSLFPAGEGKHFIRIRKKVRQALDLNEGDKVKVSIKVLDRDANAVIPPDLQKALRAEGLLNEFLAVTPGARNYLIRKIEDAVKPETRLKRIQALLTSLASKEL